MSNLTAKIAGAATLALAVLPAAALTTAAHAAPAPVRVRIADLDLGSAAGRAALDHRVRRAGEAMCSSEEGFAARETCQNAVRAEVHDKLAQIQATRFAVR